MTSFMTLIFSVRWHAVTKAVGMTGVCLTLLACGQSDDGLGTVKVSGEVLMDGRPLREASVMLHPIDENGKFVQKAVAQGYTDKSGKFQLTTFRTDDGAVPGKYKVTVQKSKAVLKEGGPAMGAGGPGGKAPPRGAPMGGKFSRTAPDGSKFTGGALPGENEIITPNGPMPAPPGFQPGGGGGPRDEAGGPSGPNDAPDMTQQKMEYVSIIPERFSKRDKSDVVVEVTEGGAPLVIKIQSR